jgi:predicted GNAT family acetyltransferase
MSNGEHAVSVTDDTDAHRFEAHLDGQLAGFITYRRARGALVLLHTEVLPAFEGKGVGGHLASGALDLIRQRGEKIRIVCPFVAGYVDRHPEYQDLVAE